MELLIIITAAFISSLVAKKIELQNAYGDYYYFLKNSRKLTTYTLLYGFTGIIFFLFIRYTNLVPENLIPDSHGSLKAAGGTGFNNIMGLLFFGLIIGFSSKTVLDLPISGNSNDENPITVRSIFNLIYPVSEADFKNIIARSQVVYINQIVSQYNLTTIKTIAKKVYSFLDAHPDFKSEPGERRIDLIMQELGILSEKNAPLDEAMGYLYKALGRKTFQSIFEN